jgi:hypothetical protein
VALPGLSGARPADESLLPAFFDGMTSAFDRAASRLGQREHELVVAGRRVRLRFAGPALQHLIRPLAHLAQASAAHPAGKAGLEILVWESATSGIMPPPPPWNRSQVSYRGEITGWESERIAVNFNGEQCLVSLLHRPSQRAIFWIRDAADLPYWETCAPFRTLFHWWSSTFGGQIAHAAAVGRDGEGVLLVGRGGRGKSSTAAACVDAGMEYVGDDYILLVREPRPTAHSLYHCAKIHTNFLRSALPSWSPRVAAQIGPDRKSLIYLHECLPSQIRRRLAIRAVLMPRITASPVARIVRERQSLGVLAAAPSTMFQLPDARQQSLSFFAGLARQLPAYTLYLGTDLASAPRELSAWLCEETTSRAA